MQTILLFVTIVLVAIVALVMLPPYPHPGWRRVASGIAHGVAAGGVAALVALVPRTDVVPDDLEAGGIVIAVVAISITLGIGSLIRLVRAD